MQQAGSKQAAVVSLAICQGQVQPVARPATDTCQRPPHQVGAARASPAASCENTCLAAVLCLIVTVRCPTGAFCVFTALCLQVL